MTVLLAPFTTSLVAEHLGRVGARDASVVYATSLVLVAGSFNLLWRHVTRTPGVVDDHVTTHAVRRINIQYGFGPLLYAASMVVATFSALASILVDIALAALFALPAFTFADARGRRGRSRSGPAHPSVPIPRT